MYHSNSDRCKQTLWGGERIVPFKDLRTGVWRKLGVVGVADESVVTEGPLAV
ncbi:MAG: hypothetical protein ACLS37_11475 [Alistipes sp.]